MDDLNESCAGEQPVDESSKAEVREEYRKLNEEICRQEDGVLNSNNLTQLIKRNDELYKKVEIKTVFFQMNRRNMRIKFRNYKLSV